MQHPELVKSWSRVWRIWRAIMWRVTLMWFIIAAIAVHATRTYMPEYPFLGEVIVTSTILLFFPLSFWMLRVMINRNFKDFRLSLIPLEKEEDEIADDTTSTPPIAPLDVSEQKPETTNA
ncbi:MAG: hypothetical protein MK052_09995 [Alphaproteobacteria bacterium]|nr:hypothetical protein [Alphaproteobacteria bacterium]